jgi:hypothetical protein
MGKAFKKNLHWIQPMMKKTAESVLKKPALDPAMLNNQHWIQPFPWHSMSIPYTSPNKFSFAFYMHLI